MVRNKNPKIPHDAKSRYSRTLDRPEFGRPVCIIYDACLVDSEDIDIVDVAYDDDSTDSVLRDEIQRALDDVEGTLRAELADWADYTEAHRDEWCDNAESSDCVDPTIY